MWVQAWWGEAALGVSTSVGCNGTMVGESRKDVLSWCRCCPDSVFLLPTLANDTQQQGGEEDEQRWYE